MVRFLSCCDLTSVCFRFNNLMPAFMGRNLWLARRESFLNSVVRGSCPGCLLSKVRTLLRLSNLVRGTDPPRAVTEIAGNRCPLWPEIFPLNQEDASRGEKKPYALAL
jgi:hypothetical protein